jgi:hypothetical protein
MTTSPSLFGRQIVLALTTAACATAAMSAAPVAVVQAQARYQQDMATCNSGQSNQSVATCRREAAAVLDEAKRGAVHTNLPQYQRNALLRCAVHQDEDRVACEARIIGQGDTTAGTQAGGLLRESILVKPAQ